MSADLLFQLAAVLSLGVDLRAPGVRVERVVDDEDGKVKFVCLKHNELTDDDDVINAREWRNEPGPLGPMIRRDVRTLDFSAFGAAKAFVEHAGEEAARAAMETYRGRPAGPDADSKSAKLGSTPSGPANCVHVWVRRPDLDRGHELLFVCSACEKHGHKPFGSKGEPRTYHPSSDGSFAIAERKAFEERRHERAIWTGAYIQDHDEVWMNRRTA